MKRRLKRRCSWMGSVAVAAAGAVIVSGGCASRPVTRVQAPGAAMARAVGGAADEVAVPRSRTLREVAASILPGVQVAASRQDWQIGDRVLIAVRASKPEGVTTRLVLVELTDELDAKRTEYEAKGKTREGGRKYSFKSDVAHTRITLFDEQGVRVGESVGRFPVQLLGYGPFDGAEPMVGHADALSSEEFLAQLSDADYDRVMRGWGALFTFNGSLGKKGIFKQMMEDVIVKPSLLRMILHPTAALTFGENKSPTHEDVWTGATGVDGGSAAIATIRVPLELSIADRPALTGELLAGEPVAPLSLCGGLIQAFGHRPNDAGVRVDLELMGAARGTGGQVFKKAAGE